MTITFAGPTLIGVVEDATTQALNDPTNGDVAALWALAGASASENLQANVLIEAQVPPFDPNAGNWEPGNDLFNRLETQNSTGASFDWAFYWESLPPVPGLGIGAIPLLVILLCGTGAIVLSRRRALMG